MTFCRLLVLKPNKILFSMSPAAFLVIQLNKQNDLELFSCFAYRLNVQIHKSTNQQD